MWCGIVMVTLLVQNSTKTHLQYKSMSLIWDYTCVDKLAPICISKTTDKTEAAME